MSNKPRGRKGGLPAKKAAPSREVTVQGASIEQTTEYFVGPLPHPDMLAKYNELVPDFAERLLSEYQAQGAHRRGLEAAVITGNLRAQSRGQWIAAGMFALMVAAAVVLGLAGQPLAAFGVATVDVLGFAGLYVYGRRTQERERSER